MEWLKNLVKNLPLENISEFVAKIVIWWSNLTKDIPDADLPFIAYAGASVIVLLLMILVARALPRPIGGILWMLAAAVLLTPGDTMAGTGQIAPAIANVAHGVLMGELPAAAGAFLPILAVFIVLLFVGAVWQVLRSLIETSIKKSKEAQLKAKALAEKEQAQQEQPSTTVSEQPTNHTPS